MVFVYINHVINQLHHPASGLSDGERTIIARFAEHLRTAHSTVVRIRALAVTDAELRRAMDSLIGRGWLVTSAALQWSDDDQCVLCGQGLELARAFAAQPIRTAENPSTAPHPPTPPGSNG